MVEFTSINLFAPNSHASMTGSMMASNTFTMILSAPAFPCSLIPLCSLPDKPPLDGTSDEAAFKIEIATSKRSCTIGGACNPVCGTGGLRVIAAPLTIASS